MCAQFNIRKGITYQLGQVPLPYGPFKHLTIDYVDMIHPIRQQRYLLVIVDRFSRWVEAVPTKTQKAANVIKFLRFEIPSIISSDNGTPFIENTLKQVVTLLKVKWKIGCIYHPHSQRTVEGEWNPEGKDSKSV